MARTGGTGKKKMAIRKIDNKLHLKTTFTKRRKGLFKKVAAFSASSDTNAAVFTFSPYGRAYSYGSPSEAEVLAAFYLAKDYSINGNVNNHAVVEPSSANYLDHQSETELGTEPSVVCQKYWWKKPAADVEFSEIDDFKDSLSDFRNNLISRIEDLQRRRQSLLNLFI